MNDLLRPALYDAWHDVRAVRAARRRRPTVWQIVGPVCESADFLAHDRVLALAEGDLLAHPFRRRLRDGDELELQLATARRRGDRRR